MNKLLVCTAALTGMLALARADDNITYVAGSTQKICQVTGETDHEFNTPTASQTETRYGLVGADLGYSFEHNGRLFFLFGDASNLVPQPAREPSARVPCSNSRKRRPCAEGHRLTARTTPS